MSSGPEFGSVPPPVKMVPKASPNTQITAATTMARTRVALAADDGRYTPTAMITKAMASTIEAARPWWATSEAAPRPRAASQPGSPLSMPAIMPFSACGARFPGSSAK